MAEDASTDWRLQGQEKYLKNATLRRKSWSQIPKGPDHDHCEFCWAKFAAESLIPDALHEGYATLDNYRWICPNCFEDFKDRFQWRADPD